MDGACSSSDPPGTSGLPVGIGSIIRARGLAPSIGAGGTIVVAVLCCLVFVSALLTFRSWPGDDGPSADGSISLQVPRLKAEGRTQPRPPAPVVAAPARRASRAPAAARTPRRTATRRVVSAPRRPAPRGTAPAPSGGTSPSTPPSKPAPAPSGGSSGGGTTPQPPTQTGPVEETISGARDVVRQVAPPLPPVVQQPVDGTLDTVQGVARTVDGVTGPLLP
jgi:hypothetical protein